MIKKYKFHKVAEIFPLLEDAEISDLANDIKENGLKEKIWLHQDGTIIDGRNRYLACKEVGIEPSYRTWNGKGSLVGFVVSLNLKRRHLNASQKAAIACNALPFYEKEAKERQVRKPDSVVEKIPQQNKGKARDKAGADFGVSGRYIDDFKEIEKQAPKLAGDIIGGRITISKAKKQVKKKVLTAKRKKEAAKAPQDVDIIAGDFREKMKDLKSSSVDLIFTDPPYGAEWVPLYEDLGKLGNRVLKPGASLICYVGHHVIDQVLELITPHLKYWWIAALIQDGPSARIGGRGVFAEWKPLLWFVKGGKRRGKNFISDRIYPELDKEHHDWGQSIIEARFYIKHLTVEKELVVDPFCGGGTTCAAAKMLGRRYKGCEIDKETAKYARARVAKVQRDT